MLMFVYFLYGHECTVLPAYDRAAAKGGTVPSVEISYRSRAHMCNVGSSTYGGNAVIMRSLAAAVYVSYARRTTGDPAPMHPVRVTTHGCAGIRMSNLQVKARSPTCSSSESSKERSMTFSGVAPAEIRPYSIKLSRCGAVIVALRTWAACADNRYEERVGWREHRAA